MLTFACLIGRIIDSRRFRGHQEIPLDSKDQCRPIQESTGSLEPNASYHIVSRSVSIEGNVLKNQTVVNSVMLLRRNLYGLRRRRRSGRIVTGVLDTPAIRRGELELRTGLTARSENAFDIVRSTRLLITAPAPRRSTALSFSALKVDVQQVVCCQRYALSSTGRDTNYVPWVRRDDTTGMGMPRPDSA